MGSNAHRPIGFIRVFGASALWLSAATITAQAQTSGVLERVQVVGGGAQNCSAVFVSFNSPLKYVSHTFSGDGNSIFIRLTGRAGANSNDVGDELIQTYPQLTIPGHGSVGVSIGPSGAATILIFRFSQSVSPLVSQAGDSSIVVSEIAPAGSVFCSPSESDPVAGLDGPVAEPGSGDHGASAVSDANAATASDEIESDYAAARAAITAQEYNRAVQLLTRLTSMPTHERSAQSQELLGVVRERNDQLAHAQAEYEIYLENFPDGEGAVRVRQRLAGILTAQSTPGGQLRDASSGFAGLPAPIPTADRQPGQRVRTGGFRALRPLEDEPEEPTFFASVSSYYYLNQGSTVLNEFSTGTTSTDDDVFQNSLVTSFDVSDSYENDVRKLSWRILGDHEIDFANSSAQSISLSRAYVDVNFKEPGFSLKFGRQTKNNAGIFGRFDGALLSWPRTENMTFNFVAGLPVDSSSDDLFASNRLLFGASVDFANIWPNIEATAYVVQQNVGSLVDRQAIGLEAQYLDDTSAAFALIDYDLHFGRINTARVTGTKIFADQSSLTLSADYTHSPLLTFSNALQGQTATTLSALAATYTLGEIDQLALDRTTTTSSLTAAYSKPINDNWQISVDGSVFHSTGSPASGGVAAVAATGLDLYASAQVVGTGIFSDRDVVSVSVRYADTASSELFLLDAYRRFDYSEALRLKPRLKVGHRNISSTGGAETFVIPSVVATYMLDSETEFELELGSRFSNQDSPTFASESNEFFAVAGFRKDF